MGTDASAVNNLTGHFGLYLYTNYNTKTKEGKYIEFFNLRFVLNTVYYINLTHFQIGCKHAVGDT